MDVLERLSQARTTAANDDMSESRSEKRRRHTDRIGAMYMATDEIERLRLMAYQPADKHEPRCDCLHCVPF